MLKHVFTKIIYTDIGTISPSRNSKAGKNYPQLSRLIQFDFVLVSGIPGAPKRWAERSTKAPVDRSKRTPTEEHMAVFKVLTCNRSTFMLSIINTTFAHYVTALNADRKAAGALEYALRLNLAPP
jgi:hypothetical protein